MGCYWLGRLYQIINNMYQEIDVILFEYSLFLYSKIFEGEEVNEDR